jgi:hypothetical protein
VYKCILRLKFFVSHNFREKAEATFLSPEFQENIERYFVENIKVSSCFCACARKECKIIVVLRMQNEDYNCSAHLLNLDKFLKNIEGYFVEHIQGKELFLRMRSTKVIKRALRMRNNSL